MRKALDKLTDEERYELLYLVDLCIAFCLSGLVVSILHGVTSLF
jgi:hypothetical protein